MSRRALGIGLVLGAALAACTVPTSLLVSVTFDPDAGINQLSFSAEVADASLFQNEVFPDASNPPPFDGGTQTLLILVSDKLTEPVTVTVDGLAGGVVVAEGSGTQTPLKGNSEVLSVSLQPLDAGGCNCDPRTSDGCFSDGGCKCGTAAACANGLACQRGTCACVIGVCQGCCSDAGQCLPGTTNQACGLGGAACTICPISGTGTANCGLPTPGVCGTCGCTAPACCSGSACYGAFPACRLVSGACNFCPPARADHCGAAGACLCGGTAACSLKERCDGGVCVAG